MTRYKKDSQSYKESLLNLKVIQKKISKLEYSIDQDSALAKFQIKDATKLKSDIVPLVQQIKQLRKASYSHGPKSIFTHAPYTFLKLLVIILAATIAFFVDQIVAKLFLSDITQDNESAIKIIQYTLSFCVGYFLLDRLKDYLLRKTTKQNFIKGINFLRSEFNKLEKINSDLDIKIQNFKH